MSDRTKEAILARERQTRGEPPPPPEKPKKAKKAGDGT